MPSEPLFTNFFGSNATQNEADLIIKKADLVAPVGLVPSYDFTAEANNRSEQLALALVLRWLRNQDQSTDSQFILTPFEQTLEFRLSKWQRKYVAGIEIYIDDTVSTFPNPNLV